MTLPDDGIEINDVDELNFYSALKYSANCRYGRSESRGSCHYVHLHEGYNVMDATG